ncbi:DUF3592 domain-containing protein [Jeotgalibaca caeni]|uniref:DUF3592 domain-containing protein n=1 Tax=Jeotgalibaca caeni TaxID=3028623 RepID=UPI00237E7D57|nr:DUF3592 domain-containing protein [Jeotgalibaca caeni]MDE1547635.1 DUF3592 domain-containing protein [Jeotgalibaca caeni]
MSDSEVMDLVALILVIVGVLFIIAGFVLNARGKRKAERCTSRTTGEVFGYDARGNGVFFPRVAFKVRNKEYQTRLHYRNQVVKSTPAQGEAMIEGDPLSTTIRIKRNSMVSGNPLENVFPRGTEMKVYYNPNDPTENYVERYAGSLMPFLLILSGFMDFGIAALFYFLF